MILPRFTRLHFETATPDIEGVVALNFHPSKPLDLRAGQHGLWYFPGGGLGPFTVASAPEEDIVTIGTSLASKSRIKRAMAQLRAGDAAYFFGPLSAFSLDPTVSSVVMLAQGMGVTPFRSILRHLSWKNQSPSQHPIAPEPKIITTLVHVGHVHPFSSDTDGLATTAAYPHTREQFANEVVDATSRQPDAGFMVSGASEFVSKTTELLTQLGIDSSRIRRDKFWGYHPLRPSIDSSAATAGARA